MITPEKKRHSNFSRRIENVFGCCEIAASRPGSAIQYANSDTSRAGTLTVVPQIAEVATGILMRPASSPAYSEPTPTRSKSRSYYRNRQLARNTLIGEDACRGR